MSTDEQLRQWLIQLSDMVGGKLSESSDLDDGLLWFTNLSDGELDAIYKLGEDNPSIEKFLSLGRELLHNAGI